jgi:lactate dehydrogenase-like 2-hydroxyacid dehydrogenase
VLQGARIVNVARGGVIDDAALARALDAGIVAQAALDVFHEEPPKWDTHPLVNRPDVIVTPHLGASTTGRQQQRQRGPACLLPGAPRLHRGRKGCLAALAPPASAFSSRT